MEEVREAAAKANALGFIENNEFGNFQSQDFSC